MTIQRYPYAQVPAEVARHIRELGGRPLNLYRVLANAPPMLKIWVDFAYAVRRECKTPRSLRELMILAPRSSASHFTNGISIGGWRGRQVYLSSR